MSHILYSSPDVTIIDIPTSISSPPGLRLRSFVPQKRPFTLPEPKAPSATVDDTHSRLLPLITSALSAPLPKRPCYYVPRHTSPAPPGELNFHENTSLLLPSEEPIVLDPHATSTVVDDISDIYSTLVINPQPSWHTLTLLHPTPPKSFHIPPHSSFLLSTLDPARFAHVLGKRDLVLLDPPWPNASAKRKRGLGAYKTESRFGIMPLLMGLPLADVVKPQGLVGVWITNKPALRQRLGELWDAWGCEEVAEWVWVKITAAGEPVMRLDSWGRKPYEVLVIARRCGGGGSPTVVQVPEKVLLGVPDLHSRKPAMKALLEPFLPTDYSAAEIFGRNLTEKWFTWGDEAIKWNWEGYWVEFAEKPNKPGWDYNGNTEQ